MEDESVELEERTSLEIAERSLALIAVVARAFHENWVGDWADRFGIVHYLSPAEKEFFDVPALEQQTIIDFTWRAEALVSLVWSLDGLKEMPPLSDQYWVMDSDFVAAAIKNPNAFRLSAQKRPSKDIEEMEDFLYHQHGRIRDRQLGFKDGGLRPLDTCKVPVDQLVPSVVVERRYGLSWVVGWGEDWDDVPTDT